MSIEVWVAFALASIVLIIIPGPTILTVISYSITHGHKAKLPLVVAVTLGDSTALVLSLLGLGALLAESALWFQVIKWIGGLYLLYLGLKLIIAGVNASSPELNDAQTSSRKLFINTYLVTALNPKGIVFFVAFLPQFINPDAGLNSQLWILALTFVVLATINAALYAVFAERARQLLLVPEANRVFNLCGGSLLSAAGIWALSAKYAE